MTSYDHEHLRQEYFKSLSLPVIMPWLRVTEFAPTPFTEVLVTGPTHKHQVGYLDCAAGCWIVGDRAVGFDVYPHWMPLPTPPFYDQKEA